MPDPNGTAVVMKFLNTLELEQYLYCLSIKLHANLYEIVPVQVNKSTTANQVYQKENCSLENKGDKRARLQTESQKANACKKRKKANETDLQRQNRLEKDRLYKQQKRSQETDCEKQIRLEKNRLYKNQRHSEETESERQIRLEKHRLYKKQKMPKRVSQCQNEISQQDYLNMFDITQNGGIEQQCWAKANINKFYKSVQYTISQCIVCQEAWPLKSRPKAPYVCSRCVKDKKSPRKFSLENSMIPSSVPQELQDLTQIEEMLIACALPIMIIFIKPGGQRGYSGHCINLPQNVKQLATSLPRYPRELSVIIVKVKGKG